MRKIIDYVNNKDIFLMYNRLKNNNIGVSKILVFYIIRNNTNDLILHACPIDIRNKKTTIKKLKLIKSNPNFNRFL